MKIVSGFDLGIQLEPYMDVHVSPRAPRSHYGMFSL